VNAARSVLVGQSDSLEALSLAEGYFRKALALRPQNAEIKVERELARQYLQAQADFTAGRWGEVIRALEIVHAHEPWYALGTSRQTLYEAYVARGDGYMANGEFDSALSDYQRAVQLAEQDEEAVLRLYEAQIRLGDAQAAQGNFEAAVVHYRSAVEVSGLRQRALQDNPAAAAALQEAQEYTGLGNFAVAYERYRRAIRLAGSTQRTVVHVVQSQEYLTLIASRYGSTVRSIVLANGIENPNLIFPGQELIVPVLP
jgi:tetratricopeptide (TPR) repeat protein